MKRLLLTAIACFIMLFSQAQCQADFQYTSSGLSLNVISTSINAGSTLNSQTPTWDFGDGSPQVIGLDSINYTYQNAGVYNVCIEIFTWPTSWTTCSSTYCDSILVGNILSSSWDCTPATGCYDPGTGNGQYTTLAACQAACTITPSWDCAPNTPVGCYDPGTGLGQYTSLVSCQAVCGTPTPSWDCGTGCYDPGTGLGQYATLASCQSNCGNTTSNYCDSMTSSGSQNQITMQVNNINSIIDYWITTAPDGTVLGEDSLWNMHNVYNYNPMGIPYDTITTCIIYTYGMGITTTCCVTWIWDANLGLWSKIGSVTSIGEIGSFDKKLLKVVDVLGRKNKGAKNKLLFYIYDNGKVEKKIIIE